jgi:hypothetical protein
MTLCRPELLSLIAAVTAALAGGGGVLASAPGDWGPGSAGVAVPGLWQAESGGLGESSAGRGMPGSALPPTLSAAVAPPGSPARDRAVYGGKHPAGDPACAVIPTGRLTAAAGSAEARAHPARRRTPVPRRLTSTSRADTDDDDAA